MPNWITWETVQGLIRHVLTFGGGFLVTWGYITPGELPEFVGAAITILGVIFSAISANRKVEAKKVEAAVVASPLVEAIKNDATGNVRIAKAGAEPLSNESIVKAA